MLSKFMQIFPMLETNNNDWWIPLELRNQFHDLNFKKALAVRSDLTQDSYYYEIDLPGFEEKEITVTVDDSRLIVRAKQNHEGQKVSFRKEVVERFDLEPKFYDLEKIEAVLKNGVLRINIPKKKAAENRKESKKIDIKVC